MTSIQNDYWRNQETARANRAQEAETNRANLAKEVETNRANVAKETETNRSNVAKEKETTRHNYRTEIEAAKNRLLDEKRVANETSRTKVQNRADTVNTLLKGVSTADSLLNSASNRKYNKIRAGFDIAKTLITKGA
nr:hypothetical protein [Picobirnavirus sp.]